MSPCANDSTHACVVVVVVVVVLWLWTQQSGGRRTAGTTRSTPWSSSSSAPLESVGCSILFSTGVPTFPPFSGRRKTKTLQCLMHFKEHTDPPNHTKPAEIGPISVSLLETLDFDELSRCVHPSGRCPKGMEPLVTNANGLFIINRSHPDRQKQHAICEYYNSIVKAAHDGHPL